MAKRDKMMFDDFNSIKVRLKRISFIGFTYSLQYFNSIKVRLKRYYPHAERNIVNISIP